MGKTKVQPPKPVPRLTPSLVGATADVIARESTDHAAAIDRLQRKGDVITQNTADIVALTESVAAVASGRMLMAPALLTGSGSGTLPAGTCVVRLRIVGQGGGGGGVRDAGAGAAGGAGGSSGDLLEVVIGTPGTPLGSLAYSWAMGTAGGGGGSTSGGNGANGQDSTVTVDATVYSSSGGGGGGGMSSTAANANAFSTIPAGTTSSSGTHGFVHGGGSLVIGGALWFSGAGGGLPGFGSGGQSAGGATAGGAATGYGAGGGGAATANPSGGKAGGAGAPGAAYIEAYS